MSRPADRKPAGRFDGSPVLGLQDRKLFCAIPKRSVAMRFLLALCRLGAAVPAWTRRRLKAWPLPVLSFTALLSLFTACTQDAYEKGEGRYSLLRGDFAEAHVDAAKQAIAITTDDGESLTLTKPFTAFWISRPDTTYRCMLYYNKVENPAGGYRAEVVSMRNVPCAAPVLLPAFDRPLKTDPVKFQSIWMSRSGKYLNLRLQLMAGAVGDSLAAQQLALVQDTVFVNADHSRTARLLLHHDQKDVPEYYFVTAYVSLPVSGIPADSVRLSLNTYSGPVSRTVAIRYKPHP